MHAKRSPIIDNYTMLTNIFIKITMRHGGSKVLSANILVSVFLEKPKDGH